MMTADLLVLTGRFGDADTAPWQFWCWDDAALLEAGMTRLRLSHSLLRTFTTLRAQPHPLVQLVPTQNTSGTQSTRTELG